MSAGRESSLGLFVPFARAYGRADALTRAQVEAAGRSYEARLITEDTYLARLSDILQVPLRERTSEYVDVFGFERGGSPYLQPASGVLLSGD